MGNLYFFFPFLFLSVSHIQEGRRWYRNARAICSRGQILHWIPSSSARRSNHPGELPQPDHTGHNPSPGKTPESVPSGDIVTSWLFVLFLLGFFLTVLIWFCLRMVTSQNSCWKKGLHAVWTGPWLFTPRELKNSELLNGTQQKIHFDTS